MQTEGQMAGERLGFTKEGRIPGLDALRGLAAISVAVFHYHYYYNAGPDLLVLLPVYNGSHFLVELFFVLSGFLLTQVYSNNHSYSGLVIRRVARLFPLQWLTLLLVAIEQYFFAEAYGKPFVYKINDSYHFLLNALLIQQVGLQSGFSFNGPSWSISVEWVVNLLFFGLMLSARLLLPCSILIAAGSVVLLAISQPSLTDLHLSFGFLDTGLLRVGFGFFVGVIAAKIVMYFQPQVNGRWDLAALVNAVFLIYFLSSTPVNSLMPAQFVIVALVMPTLVIACSRGKIVGRILSIRPLTWLGDISYSVYLIHFPLLILIWGFRFKIPIALNSGEGLVCYTAIVMMTAHLVFNYFERPSQKLLLRYLSPRRAASSKI
ncbi:hypothetical protein A1353_02670 [Methylomonas methanica]|jgi:peptidoglycan/LPS O-acetylase OafA/YrhL|uniref:Acyltransferase 3 domain-containing protein n=2 Tax=Methylomonas methanica TaxID=421 RepID=A0A177LVM0_METMH|nr:hypothetical protein A1353_02670 [Methylomonas methanica]